MSPPVSATPPPLPPLPELRDFSDRLPAVLVKELRQGLRGRLFVAGFCTLHALLVLASMDGGRSGSRFFWFCLSVMFIFVLPSRNLGALGEERQEKTLDTLILTSLTPWRIVWGKWSATAALAGLTAVSVLPYLFIRYLHGGTSFLSEAAMLSMLLFCFCGLSAVFVAASSIRSPLTRNGFAVILSIFVYYQVTELRSAGVPHGAGWAFESLAALAFYGILAVWVTLFFLWQAAGSIAPLTANTAAPRRLITLAVFVLCLLTGLIADGGTRRTAFAFAAVILLASGLVELGDRPPPAHIPFVWRGRFRSAAAVFLSPGWASGLCFLSVLVGLWALLPAYGYARTEYPLHMFVPVFAAPIVYRQLLPASARWGAAPLVALAVISHVAGDLLARSFPDFEGIFGFLFPGIHENGRGQLTTTQALIWLVAAFAIAVRPLLATFRRAVRQKC